MAWRLAFDGVNDHCTFPTALSVNLGTEAYSFECAIRLSAFPVSGKIYGIIGRLGTRTGFAVTPDGRLAMYGAGTLRYQTSAGLFLSDSVQHVYRLEHDAGGAWRVYRDNLATPVESGTFTTSTIAGGMNRIGTATGGDEYLQGELAYADLQIPVDSQRWDANLSGGTGTTLPTVSGTNQGTLVNFTLPAAWVFYSSGATYDLQALGGTFAYSGATAALNRGFRLDATGGTFSYSGAVADLTYNTATVYRIDALGGNFTYTGAQATLLRNFRVDATGGAFSYVGGVASLSRGYMMQSQGGTFSYAGADASLTYVSGPMVYTITALGGTFSYTGAAAEFTATGVIPAANPASFVNRAYVGGRLTNSAKIGGRLTNNATVAI